MRWRIACICYLFCLTLGFLFPATVSAYTPQTPQTSQTPQSGGGLADFPTVDPNYIYTQLFYMVTHFQHRESGYDKNLPANINGHDEFAAYWSQEMTRDLQGFAPQVRRDDFPIKGWTARPATVPAFNVEVSVPGVTHPEQTVVIGCHYDGEAISTQSANDDGSGCTIELGVAKALGAYWRSHHVYPARTLRFVIFDAEEQGLFGSFHYVNSTLNGDLHNITAMFNEEQNGIAYPLRYLGKQENPLLPFYIDLSPLQNNQLYGQQNLLSPQQRANITRFRALMQQAIVAAFQQFYALGDQMLSYHGANNQDVFLPIFTPDQKSNVRPEDDTLGSSDQVPFTLAGLPCATFVGDSGYYDSQPPGYPFDQHTDTIQLMNTFADGSSQQSNALTLALGLPAMLTTWMLHQSDILGESSLDQNPVAAISDIGQTQAGQSLALDAKAAFDPKGQPLSYNWNFGDGTQATGASVNHTYTTPGTYTLSLTVSSASGKRVIQKTITVSPQAASYNNVYGNNPGDGAPPTNPNIILPGPNDALKDRIATATTAPKSVQTAPTVPVSHPSIVLFISIGIAALAFVVFIGIMIRVFLKRQQT